MRKFDLEAFEKHKKDNNTYCRYITKNTNGDTIEIFLTEHKDSYQQTIIYLNTPIKQRFMYHKKTLTLIKEIESFYDCIIGFQREYDDEQELIKEINNDEPYKFSWQDLVNKMKNEYQIDLMDEKEQIKNNTQVTFLSRNSQTMKYSISMPCEFTPHGVIEEKFEIDAITGNTIYHIGNKRNKHSDLL
ncbi:hypothetical protein NJT12_10545 [Flavobacterium sp. AC]|uniref:Uncharacterized protein n=1 Tax=Flavobacterium azizsancarii TaxID=2961580 RepID=A0ABT4WBY1_9FLAO|nr:hypothetical protein [Flavobacterium azizsancarii]MDA6070056.1 hypothetical protein [Flavobacterium azizsancarii]